jgi:hypothetical protein
VRRAAACALGVLAVVGLSACESTQDKSAELAKKAKKFSAGQKLVITKENRDVKVGKTTVLKDANGAAVVVELHSDAHGDQVKVPIAIDVKGAKGKTVFRNDAPGLEPTLVSAPVVAPHATTLWVNDQVVAATKPESVAAKVGEPATAAPKQLPKLTVQTPTLKSDPVSGVFAEGYVKNDSKLVQRKLVLFAVARKGGKVVAAGRGQIKKLNAGRRAKYSIFFIGNPKGAKLEVTAPPSVLK